MRRCVSVGGFLVLMSLLYYCARGDGGRVLQAGFYRSSCPDLEQMVFDAMQEAVQNNPRLAASMVRLFFHDCFVQGCDASILLDETPSIKSEKNADPNINSVRGFEVIDTIKATVERFCPNLVSCADIIALAARDGVVLSNGPTWEVLLGRRDGRTAGFEKANNDLPSPFFEVDELIGAFQSQGLSVQDLVTLSGAHTFGKGRCIFYRDRLYNMTGDGKADPRMDKVYVEELKRGCPEGRGGAGDDNEAVLDPSSPAAFDNRYFLNLMYRRGLFISDQTLYSSFGSPSVQLVRNYSQHPSFFFSEFATSMIKLGNLPPLPGSQGEIRRNCRTIN